MTKEQIEKFKRLYDGWIPTEEQFQYAIEMYKKKGHWCAEEKKQALFQLKRALNSSYVDKIWDSTIIPLIEDIKVYNKINKEMKELYGITD